ncbi:MAG: sigma-70 family RNA polymerase sigma factor [Planctomycetes bacterium]|nr:sigma-70 family RNA polymerase sigma factor [Planctomycetota bacterium]
MLTRAAAAAVAARGHLPAARDLLRVRLHPTGHPDLTVTLGGVRDGDPDLAHLWPRAPSPPCSAPSGAGALRRPVDGDPASIGLVVRLVVEVTAMLDHALTTAGDRGESGQGARGLMTPIDEPVDEPIDEPIGEPIGDPIDGPIGALLATRGRLREFVARRVPAGVEPEDVVQDVLTRLLARTDEIPPGKVQAWALTSARHAVIDLLRRRRPAILDAASLAAPDDEADAFDLARCLRPLLDSLDADDRWVLEQVDAGGRPQADLARELGVPASTVKSRVQRARQRLRAVIERCCELELDGRGVPIDARRRERRPCDDCD